MLGRYAIRRTTGLMQVVKSIEDFWVTVVTLPPT
jgi:hypothetical protein